jgi:methionyl-tRNA synthetase
MTHVLSAVAWPYANGPRHIGHVAGFGVPSDVFSRYMRMAGHDVLMVSGTDEHGTPILVQAEKEGVGPQELADRYNRVIVEDLQALGLSYDLFTRTSTRNHHQVVQTLFRAVHANGYVVAQTALGAISPRTGRTLPDRYIEGTCPICGYTSARGDQCDNCGNQLDPVDLLDPRSRIDGESPTFVETEHLFLDLPALAEALGEWLAGRRGGRRLASQRAGVQPQPARRRPAARHHPGPGLGHPGPAAGWEDNPAKRIYVWFDAVVGYLSASVEWARRQGDPERWREWWNDPEALSYYFMGKDNITFHSQIWPAELLGHNGQGAAGGEQGPFGPLRLPTEVVSSEFLTMEGKQFSSSRGDGHLRP